MPKKQISKTSFNAGQLTPYLEARIDVNKYDNGVASALNVEVIPHGPIKKRNGFKAIGIIKNSAVESNFIRFQFSQDDAFQIEVADNAFRFWKNDGPVLNTGKTITAVTKANPGVVTAASHGFSNGQQVYITGVTGMVELNDHIVPYTVANVTTNTFELKTYEGAPVNTSGYTTYISGGTVASPYELTTPYDITDMELINYEQFGDLVYIAHPNVPTQVLTRLGDTNWTIADVKFDPPPTYVAGYYPTGTVTPAATSGSAVNFTSSGSVWLQGDVGRQIVNESTGETGTAVITSITSSSVAVANIITNFTDTNAIASGDWKLDASPVAELTFSGTVSGTVQTVTCNYPTGFKGEKVAITGMHTNGYSPMQVAWASNSISASFGQGDKFFFSEVTGCTEVNRRTLTWAGSSGAYKLMNTGDGAYFSSFYMSGWGGAGYVQKVYTEVPCDTFRAADVGKYIIANDGVLKILSITNANEVKALVVKSLSTADFTNNWTLEEPTWTADRGYPRAVGFYNQRLVLAGYDAEPLEVNFSEVGIFEGFGRGSQDSDAIQVDISAAEINQIKWLTNTKKLVIGTSGSELSIDAPSAASGLSASNIRQEPNTADGSDTQKPVKIGSEVIFTQKSGRKILSFRYDFNIDNYNTEDLTFLAEDITSGIVKRLAYAQEPSKVIYATTEAGELLACTYNRAQDVIGWTKFDTDGFFESVQTISEDNRDKVYVIVKRTINGNTRRYIEVLDNGTGDSVTDGFSDCFITYYNPKSVSAITKASPGVVTSTAHGFVNGDRVKFTDITGMDEIEGKSYLVANKTTNTFELTTLQGIAIDTTSYGTFVSGTVHKISNTFSGLDHLEGKDVEVKGDNAKSISTVVTNGTITLDSYCYAVVIGLPFTSEIELLPINLDLGAGPTRGQQVRFVNPILDLYKASLPIVNGQYLASRNTDDLMDNAVPLYTGLASYGNLEWDNSGVLSIDMSGPFPCTLIGIFGEAETNLK